MKYLLTIVLSVLLTTSSWSADINWDGGGADNSWHTAANWAGDVIPGCEDRAIFGTNDGTIEITLSIQVGGIYNSGALINHISGTMAIGDQGLIIDALGSYQGGTGDLLYTSSVYVPNGALIYGTGVIANIIKMTCSLHDESYAHLNEKLDGGFYETNNDKLYFRFDEDYTRSQLDFKVFEKTRDEVSGILLADHGYGLYELDLTNAQFLTTSNPFYVLEVDDGKGRKYKLRFKHTN